MSTTRTFRQRVRSFVDAVAAAPLSQPFRPLLHLICYYPLLLPIPALLLLLLWNGLLAEYDAFHQLWNEERRAGILAGALVATVFGETILAVHLLDRVRQSRAETIAKAMTAQAGSALTAEPAEPAQPAPAPAPVDASEFGPPVPRWAYWVSWALLLVAGVTPAATLDSQFVYATDPLIDVRAQEARLWFPTGVIITALVFGGLRFFRRRWFDRPLALGAGIAILLGTGFLALTVAHCFLPEGYCPWFPAPVCLLLLFAYVTALLAGYTYLAGRTPLLYPALFGWAALAVGCPALQTEHRLPNMEMTGADGKTYYDERVHLANYESLASVSAKDAGLIDDEAALVAWHERMKQRYGEPQPVVLVTVSGGASASALYCADVLFTFEERFPGFSDRVRVISGASGGMLGAAYFVTQLRDGGLIDQARDHPDYRRYVKAIRDLDTARKNHATAAAVAGFEKEAHEAEPGYKKVMEATREQFLLRLRQDFLGPLVQKWVHQDMPTGMFGRHTDNNRGLALEAAWKRHLRGALDVPFRDLREEESKGVIPSLVFTPMMIEDGRQVVISNLDLGYMRETAQNQNGKPLSYMGVEFFRMFPRADRFKLSTAVRMNASFPYLSPAAALPTDPVRHVVDAGYYDNYGTTVATKWLNQHTDWLTNHYWDEKHKFDKPAEVILLQIRCFGYERGRYTIVTEEELNAYARMHHKPIPGPAASDELRQEWAKDTSKKPVDPHDGAFSLTGPFSGLFSSWRANMVYRADERLGGTTKVLSLGSPNKLPRVKLSAYPIECQTNPSLNWVLSAADVAALHADAKQLNDVADFTNFSSGRSPQAPAPPPVSRDAAPATKATLEARGAAAKDLGRLTAPPPRPPGAKK